MPSTFNGQGAAGAATELQRYFGPLRNSEVEAWAQDQFAHETHNLPKAYEGRNKFLMATIDFLITKDDDWYTSVALPWEFTEELHVAWNIWRFISIQPSSVNPLHGGRLAQDGCYSAPSGARLASIEPALQDHVPT